MEEQLHIQEKSNSIIASREKILASIKDNLNYIYILLMVVVNILISILRIEDGTIGLNYPHTLLGWCLWAGQILAQTLIGVLLMNAYRRQGVKNGHKVIKDTYNEYLKAITKKKDVKPRSLAQYYKTQIVKDSLIKSIILIALSVLVGSAVISANLNNLLSLVVTLLIANGFGLKTMLDAEEFVITELVIWYQLKIAEVTDQKLEPAKEDIKCQENVNLITRESLNKLETFLDKLSSTEEKM